MSNEVYRGFSCYRKHQCNIQIKKIIGALKEKSPQGFSSA